MHKNNNRILIRVISYFNSIILTIFLFIGCFCFVTKTFSQSQTISGCKIFHFTSSNTCFPEIKRMNGYTYDGQVYDFSNHYRDSSVLIIVPDGFKEINNAADIIFWFHGWHNNIDTALNYYHLASQFVASHKNAILILAEAAKNAPILTGEN